MKAVTDMRPPLVIASGCIFPRLGRGILLLLCLVVSITARAADEGEVMTSAPVPYKTYTFTPGKLTGKQFWLENIEKKDKILCREFCFDQFLVYKKPAETVSMRLSLRGGYRPHDLFGHDDFEPKEAQDVATGWVPQSSGSFIIYPDLSKEHVPKWIPERTKMIRVPFIKQYGDKVVNAYDIALGLDRVNNGQLKTIDFRLVPITDDNGKQAIRLVPTIPLTDGVYFAYSLPDGTDTDIYGFLFAVGTPGSGSAVPQASQEQTTVLPNICLLPDVKFALDVMDYALLCQAVYDTVYYKPVGKWAIPDEFNCPVGLEGIKCSINKISDNIEYKFTGFYAQVYKNGNKFVIAFRGTELLSIRDWLADQGNKLGLIPAQYYDALSFAQQVVDKIEKANSQSDVKYELVLTGHSLGGGLAAYVALTLGKPAVVFNAAGLGSGLLSAIGPDRLKKNSASITNVHLEGDPMLWIDFWIKPTKQVGVLAPLRVPHDFLFYDSDGKNPINLDEINRRRKQTETAINLQIKQRELALKEQYPGSTPPTINIPPIVSEGDTASLNFDFNAQPKIIFGDSKLSDHAGGGFNITIDPITLEPSVFAPESIWPHYIANVINALKAKAGIK